MYLLNITRRCKGGGETLTEWEGGWEERERSWLGWSPGVGVRNKCAGRCQSCRAWR